MRTWQAPAAHWAAVTGVVLAVVAAPVTVVIALEGRAFSFAGPDAVGRVALLGPVALCLGAAVVHLARHRDRPLQAMWVTAAAVAWLLTEWDNPEVGSAWVFSLGLAGYAMAPAVVLHVALADARGALRSHVERAIVTSGYAVTLGVQGVLTAVGSDPSSSGCVTCPANLWHAFTVDTWGRSLDAFGVRAGLVWSVLAMSALLVTGLRASAARRRAQGPRWLVAGLFLALTVASYARSVDRGFLGSDVVDRRIWLLQAAALAGVAAAVLAELARERRVERALAGIVVDLSGASASLGSLRQALAVRLDDPELVLAFPVDGIGLLDESASPVEAAPHGARLRTELRYDGEALATVLHRRDVLGTPEAVATLVATMHLGLEHERLRVEALAQVNELRASAIRLVETGDEERRRLERDLHDGAQQRLVGIALGLRLLTVRSGESAAVREATTELQAAIDELRALARGLSPLVLTQAGLGSAVRALGESRDLRLVDAPNRRFPAVVESTAYLAVDRATAASPGEVVLREQDGVLVVTVLVRGPAPDLVDLADRATTVGGEVAVRLVPGGCEMSVRLPIPQGDEMQHQIARSCVPSRHPEA